MYSTYWLVADVTLLWENKVILENVLATKARISLFGVFWRKNINITRIWSFLLHDNVVGAPDMLLNMGRWHFFHLILFPHDVLMIWLFWILCNATFIPLAFWLDFSLSNFFLIFTFCSFTLAFRLFCFWILTFSLFDFPPFEFYRFDSLSFYFFAFWLLSWNL